MLLGAGLRLLVARRVVRSFSAAGVTTVILRASAAESARIGYRPPGSEIVVSGLPAGGASGYHPGSWWWSETSPRNWGLDFVARPFGPVLVISTRNEIGFMHHHYYLDAIALDLPEGLLVLRVPRELSGEGAPDLRAP